jgi:hypothetical protein
MDYSHPHPQVQGPMAQGQADPQVQLQPQEQLPDFVVISVMVVLSLDAGGPARLRGLSHLLTHQSRNHYSGRPPAPPATPQTFDRRLRMVRPRRPVPLTIPTMTSAASPSVSP